MIIVRYVQENDIDKVLKLAEHVDFGLTNLPADWRIISNKIRSAIVSYHSEEMKLENKNFFFVMEDLTTHEIIGCCAILSVVGGHGPFYSYKIGTLVQQNDELNIHKNIKLLNLVNDYQETTELCGLFLLKEFRKKPNGKLLSLSRLLFMAIHPYWFSEKIIAEMRGIVNKEGISPFWQHLGKHFFGIDFSQADRLTGLGKKQFIADLMPKYPVYINLLPKEAQEVIGKTHEETIPALKLLNDQGFHYNQYVDIFDGGPTLEAEFYQVDAIKNSRLVTVNEIMPTVMGKVHIIATEKNSFRSCVASLQFQKDDSVSIDANTADALALSLGDTVRIYLLGDE